MESTFSSRIKNAWNAFLNRDPTDNYNHSNDYSIGTYYRPDRTRLSRGNERSIVTSIFNRIALDVAAIDIKHCRLDDNERYKETMNSNLNNCLTLEANIDQTGRAFIQDVVMSMLDEGCVAIVPVDTTLDPTKSNSYEINTMRVGKIVAWGPKHVKVRVYNDNKGEKQEITLPKSMVGIIQKETHLITMRFKIGIMQSQRVIL